jgi:hypothetical protein
VLWIGNTPQLTLRMTSLGLGRVELTCPAAPNSSGAGAALAAQGCGSVLANALALALAGAPPGEIALFVAADEGAQAPFGNGTLCVATPYARLGGGAIDAAGQLALDVDFSKPPASSFAAGDTLHLQALFRDTGFGAGFGTSGALGFVLQP